MLYLLCDYLIIESLERIDYKEFDKVSRITLASFGFITGYAPMDYGYFFVYDNFDNKFKGFKFSSTFIGTYDSPYSVINFDINLNAFNYFPKKEDNASKLEKKVKELKKDLNPITKGMFSRLCYEMLRNNYFAEVIFMLLEVNNKTNNNSLQSKGVMYSVILEKITNIISKQNQKQIFFIKNEDLRKRFQKELRIYAKKFFENNKIKGFDNSPIKNKIDNIHSPTNRDKLLKPFEILEISLTKQEKDILNRRNDFLHGNNFFPDKEFIERRNNLLYLDLELNFLVNALILKYIGYSGKINNLSKIILDMNLDNSELENLTLEEWKSNGWKIENWKELEPWKKEDWNEVEYFKDIGEPWKKED